MRIHFCSNWYIRPLNIYTVCAVSYRWVELFTNQIKTEWIMYAITDLWYGACADQSGCPFVTWMEQEGKANIGYC